MKKKALYIIYILIVFVLILSFGQYDKPSYSATNDDYEYNTTRTNMQNYIVSTALQYYYKNKYSDYEQYALDGNGTINWREFDVSPEQASRINLYAIDCSSFVHLVYLYSLGYDLSHYYNIDRSLNFVTYNENSNTYITKNSRASMSNYQEMALKLGFAQKLGRIVEQFDDFDNLSDITSNSDVVYLYKPKFRDESDSSCTYTCEGELNISNSGSNQIATCSVPFTYNCKSNPYDISGTSITSIEDEKEKIMNSLRKGDAISVVRRPTNPNSIILTSGCSNKVCHGKNNEGTVGHTFLYVGDAINKNERGFIHSVGQDYSVDSIAINEDSFSVRYDTYDDRFINELFYKGNSETVAIAVERPLNKYCNGNNCSVNNSNVNSNMFKEDLKTNFSKARLRNHFSKLSLEQFQFEKTAGNLINKYNSVDINGTITYRFTINNKSYFNYCSKSRFTNKNDCEKDPSEGGGGAEWRLSNSTVVDFENISITASAPEHTNIISAKKERFVNGNKDTSFNSNTNVSYNNSSVSFTDISLLSAEDGVNVGTPIVYTFEYTVEVDKDYVGSINNDGFKIAHQVNDTTYSLKLGKMETNIVPEKKNINFNIGSSCNTSTFITDVYEKSYGLKLKEFNSYEEMKNSIFINLDNKWYKYADANINYLISNNDSNYGVVKRSINNMLVKGEYGGRSVRGNTNSDRARLLYKIGLINNSTMTLEVGDVFVTETSSATPEYYIFEKYNDNHLPVFLTCSNNKITRIGESDNKGYIQLKKFYSYNYFFVLRPSKLYVTGNGKKYNLSYDYGKGAPIDTNPTTAEYGQTVTLTNPRRDIKWRFVLNNSGAIIDNDPSKTSAEVSYTFPFKGWSIDNSNSINFNAAYYNNSKYNYWNGSIINSNKFANLGYENSSVTLKANFATNEEVEEKKLPTITKNGYTCYWNNKSDGTGITTAASGELRKPVNTAIAEYTWYAICQPSDNVIVSSTYNISNEISQVAPNTTKENFLSNINTTGTVSFINKTDNIVKTGDKIKVTFSNGDERIYEISIKGDVTKDGNINISDVMKIATYIIKQTGISSNVERLSADVTGEGKINISDVMKIATYIIKGTGL